MSNTLRIFGIALLGTTVCLFLASCQRHLSNTPAPDAKEQYSGEGFRLMIPRCVSVKKTERADYILYTFTSEGKGILGAYVGNQPNFLFEDRAIGPESITQLNCLPCKRVQARKQDGTLRTEVLIRFPRDRGWPVYIHFWYGSLEPEAKATAEAIIASIAPQAEGAQASSFPDPGGPDFPPQTPTLEMLEERVQELRESVKMARKAGETVDPNLLSKIELMEQVSNTIKELRGNERAQP